jgi:molybdenum cofactor biosynthesis protein B
MSDEHGHDHDHGEGHDHDDGHHGGEHGHGHHHHDVEALGVAVVTVSSSRTLSDDPSGDAIVELVEGSAHGVEARSLVEDDHDAVQSRVNSYIDDAAVDAVVTTGGTGVTPDDVTVEAVEGLFDKQLPGFGELFRQLSYDDIGTRVVGTRATAGIADSTAVFCLPGSEAAVRLGVGDIVLAEAPHLVGLARRGG